MPRTTRRPRAQAAAMHRPAPIAAWVAAFAAAVLAAMVLAGFLR